MGVWVFVCGYMLIIMVAAGFNLCDIGAYQNPEDANWWKLSS